MPDISEKLGLSLPLSNETFTRESYRQNLLEIDDKVETPAGAQAKADVSETAAKAYAEQQVNQLAGTERTTETVKGNADALIAHLADFMLHGFDNIIGKVGYYYLVEFDTPIAGDITERIKLSADNTVFATRVTEFDKPLAGNITVTVSCSSLGVNIKKVTEFDTPIAGQIKETVSEVF